jgi:hypothetical protein
LFLFCPLFACFAKEGTGPLGRAEDAGTIDFPDSGEEPSCLESDGDGDGFGTNAKCATKDCDDSNINVYPGAFEACNALDDDCDREIDEGLGEGTCGEGPCARTVPHCVNGRPQQCTPGQGSPEVCNGADDDCDGQRDEEIAGESCGAGACARSALCVNGATEACVPGAPSAELCNRADDDCDGTVDNGIGATVIDGTYTALRTKHDACDGFGQRIGPQCNAAIHRWCASDGCTTSGFGPLENSGDTAVIGCVVAAALIDTPYATLAGHHDVCDGSRERIGPNCNAAIHRYCASMGFATGFGPNEQGPSTALVACLSPAQATVISTTYSNLSGFHGGCTTSSRIGPDCNAAINRFCQSSGYATGYGPVENSGDTSIVACVSR